MSGPTEAPGPGRVPHGGDPLTLLLVEDDRADAIIVEELIADEEGHIDYLETQIELHDTIGAQNFGQLNAKPADEAE